MSSKVIAICHYIQFERQQRTLPRKEPKLVPFVHSVIIVTLVVGNGSLRCESSKKQIHIHFTSPGTSLSMCFTRIYIRIWRQTFCLQPLGEGRKKWKVAYTATAGILKNNFLVMQTQRRMTKITIPKKTKIWNQKQLFNSENHLRNYLHFIYFYF